MDNKLIRMYDLFPPKLKTFIYNRFLTFGWQKRNITNKIRYGTTDFFTDIDIEINTSCNRRCFCCPNSIFERGLIKNEKLMSEDLFKKIIDELAEINFTGRISPHSYGEPLLDKRLISFIVLIKEKLPKTDIILFSNGDLLTIEMYNKLVEAGVTSFFITLYGMDQHKPFNDLLEYLKKYPKNKSKVRYRKFTEKTPLFSRGGDIKPLVLDSNPRCKHPHNPLVIDYAGNVILCCNDYHGHVKFGNLNNSSLVDIWKNEKYKEVRNQLRRGHYQLEICRKCVGLD